MHNEAAWSLLRGTEMTAEEERPRSAELGTAERLASTARSTVDALAHQGRGEHETEHGLGSTTVPADVAAIIDGWPAPQREVAVQLLELYGPPNEATPTRLSWYRNGPWKRTELARDTIVHNWPAPHGDFLTQTIDYRVPVGMFDELARFDGSVLVDRTRGEVSARCDSEAANVASLNMVHEIVSGQRSVEDARETLEQTKVGYTLGRSAPYAERLLFEVPHGGTHFVDEPAIGAALVQQGAGKVKDVVPGLHGEAASPLTDADQRDRT